MPCDPDTHVCVPAGALAGAGPAASGRRCVAVCGTSFCGEGQSCVQGTCVTNGRLRVTLTWSRPGERRGDGVNAGRGTAAGDWYSVACHRYEEELLNSGCNPYTVHPYSNPPDTTI